MKRLFESRKVLKTGSAIPSPDVKIIFTKAPYISRSKFYWIKTLGSI